MKPYEKNEIVTMNHPEILSDWIRLILRTYEQIKQDYNDWQENDGRTKMETVRKGYERMSAGNDQGTR